MSDEPEEKEGAEDTAAAKETADGEAASAKPARPRDVRQSLPRAKRRKPAAESAPAAEAVAAPAVVTLARERSARRALTTGATLSVIGLMLVGIGPSDAGTAISLGGLIALIYGIHTYGRLGPEPAR